MADIMNNAVPRAVSLKPLTEVLTNLNGRLIYLRVNNVVNNRSSPPISALLSVMHLRRIIIDNKLARDFIDTVLLSVYSHVIELVSIAIWWLLAPPTNWCQ